MEANCTLGLTGPFHGGSGFSDFGTLAIYGKQTLGLVGIFLGSNINDLFLLFEIKKRISRVN